MADASVPGSPIQSVVEAPHRGDHRGAARLESYPDWMSGVISTRWSRRDKRSRDPGAYVIDAIVTNPVRPQLRLQRQPNRDRLRPRPN